MVKKRLPSSDTVFRFETPDSPSKANMEASRSSTDSPSSMFLRGRDPPWEEV
ncbi:GRAM domain-containing protein 2B [Saguinus oedipus]|uniref:GRAM domain-containing protein 2B n=1 Tax=Saguinus oedipus TaxID=9490 RepID=A0ABQ9W9I1_SAGOE|nr:GRAM domain-containing protein 2B [Saguinus oedipus]